MQITDRHVGCKEEIDALALVNIGLAISCQFNDPALIDFLSRLKYVSDLLRQIRSVLHAAVVGNQITPDFVRIETEFSQNAFEEAILDDMRAGNRVLPENVGSNRFD